MKKTVLYVESDPDLREKTQRWLEANEFVVIAQEDALSAERYIMQSKPHIILANHSCKCGSGLNLLSSIRLKGYSLPCILLHESSEGAVTEIVQYLDGVCAKKDLLGTEQLKMLLQDLSRNDRFMPISAAAAHGVQARV